MVEEADNLLIRMKAEIDEMLIGDKQLQHFLRWVEQKSRSVNAPYYKPVAIRAFYFALTLDRTRVRPLTLDLVRNLDQDTFYDLALACVGNLDLALALNSVFDYDFDLDLDLDLDSALDHNLSFTRDFAFDLAFDLALTSALSLNLVILPAAAFDLDLALDLAQVRDHYIHPALKKSLKELQNQLPDFQNNWSSFQQWWQANGLVWTEQLRGIMIEHRNIGHDWQFSDVQKTKLRQYYDANEILVNCLNSNGDVNQEVREQIETTLLLPVTPFASEPPLP